MLLKVLVTEIVPFIPDIIEAASKGISELYDEYIDDTDYNNIKEMSDDEIQLRGKK